MIHGRGAYCIDKSEPLQWKKWNTDRDLQIESLFLERIHISGKKVDRCELHSSRLTGKFAL
jgi:hypothetical protein